jgi:hypothetical protein
MLGSLELGFDEVLKSCEVMLVEGLLEAVQDQDRLLVRYRAEREGFDHEKHSLNDFASEQFAEERRLLDRSALAERDKKGLELLDSPDSVDSDLEDGLASLIHVRLLHVDVVLPQNNKAVID